MNFPQWKKAFIWCVCALGLLFALPNILPQSCLSRLPDWIPQQKVCLGLDLRGGVHLLLEVDIESVKNDHLNQILDSARTVLRKESIQYTANFPKSVAKGEEQVAFDIKDISKVGKAKAVLSQIDSDVIVEIVGCHVKMVPTPDTVQRRTFDAVERSMEIVRKRVDETGTREANIQRQGDNRILLQIPGLKDPSHVKMILGRTAKLTIRLVDENSKDITDKKDAVAPPGSVYMESVETGKWLAVKKQVLVGGETLITAELGYDEYNRPEVSFQFNKIGAKKFGEVTKENVGKRFAIVLDNEVICAPVIEVPITGGHGRITGEFSVERARDLSLLMRAGALPAPLNVVEEKTVGPDLGEDSIRSGILATLLSCLFVLVFMFLWYSSFGLIADIAV
ncbi:MAG: protein translocase subunit SecD, partial [Holosporaceae bacterium]|nr:protein translocase subunit SecD [Holosporaceae bacterium]